MVKRHFWITRIEDAWARRPIVWLSGVRRSGKTSLALSLDDAEYLDCELPRVRQTLSDPEGFWRSLPKGRRVVLDEIHRLSAPAELLKIAADHFPHLRVLATGSSTLGASSKFSDTLTGRKTEIRLTPLCAEDLKDFGREDLPRRLLRGGLPPFYLAETLRGGDLQEWIDSYWARDVQELFRLERRNAFMRFLELLLARSGGMFEASAFAGLCEVSRPTISNYLRAMEATHVAHVIRPFSTRRHSEIVAAPKVYGFDTGFVCHMRGWDQLRPEDRGGLWEHLVLDQMRAHGLDGQPRHWRNKLGREVDFVLPGRREKPCAIECKWSSAAFKSEGLNAFRRLHPDGENIAVCSDVDRPRTERINGLVVRFTGLATLHRTLAEALEPT